MDMPEKRWNFRCVIYDCDGVLFDSVEVNRRFYNHICSTLGRSPLTEQELRYAHSHTFQETIHLLFQAENGPIQRAFELLPRIDSRDYISSLQLEPHLLQTLDFLKERGILRAISTNRTTSMQHILDRFDLRPYFDLVVTALDVKNPKPHPESVEKIMEIFHLNRLEVVFVGDSEIDRQAAESSGIKFIAYKNREIAADAFIDDHLALIRLLAEEGNPGNHNRAKL